VPTFRQGSIRAEDLDRDDEPLIHDELRVSTVDSVAAPYLQSSSAATAPQTSIGAGSVIASCALAGRLDHAIAAARTATPVAAIR
jgi:hypothetical protein